MSPLFALASLLLSPTNAQAQTPERPVFRVTPGPFEHELPELTPEETAKCMQAAKRMNRRECDDGGCYFNEELSAVQTQKAERGCRFQKALQLRANEARQKLIEADRENRK
jgi:hypothetical protein